MRRVFVRGVFVSPEVCIFALLFFLFLGDRLGRYWVRVFDGCSSGGFSGGFVDWVS